MDERIAWFAKYGVRECWLVHQLHRRIETLEFGDGIVKARHVFAERQRVRSAVLPGFTPSLADILSLYKPF